MISERYTLTSDFKNQYLDWNKQIIHITYFLGDTESDNRSIALKGIEDLLNEQDTTINKLIKENVELKGFVEALDNLTLEQAKKSIMICADSEGVVDDLYPLFKRLLSCFNQLERESREGKGQKYKNNLIMLEYYVKEFEESCK